MKKKIIVSALVLMLVLAFAAPVFASSLNNPSLPRVVDYGDMFSDSEEKLLEDALYKLINKYGMDFMIMTAEDHGSAQDDYEFIEGVWDVNGFGTGSDSSGWAIFVCLQDRTWVHSSCGSANDYLTEDTVNIIDDFMEPEMVSGNYYDAMSAAITQLDSLFSMGAKKYAESTYGPGFDPSGNQGGQTQEPKTFWEKLMTGGISGALAGVLAGFASVGSAKRSMRTVSAAYTAGEYADRGSFRLSRDEDILLNTYTQHIPKEQHVSSGGGGSPHHSGGSSYNPPHVSSGGNVHSGGGGRHF